MSDVRLAMPHAVATILVSYIARGIITLATTSEKLIELKSRRRDSYRDRVLPVPTWEFTNDAQTRVDRVWLMATIKLRDRYGAEIGICMEETI